jgi:hypothetical protein
MKNQALTEPVLLIGEGSGEKEFFTDLLTEMGITCVQVEDYAGKNKLAAYLKGLQIRTGFDQLQRLVITRDADNDAAGAAASIQSAITAAGLPAALTVRSMVLPGDDKQGALESLWLESLKGAPYEECVERFFECLREKGWEPSQFFAKKDKALTQVWLATKNPSNVAFHRASAYGRRSKYPGDKWVDFDHPAFTPLKAFLRESLT